MRPLNGKWKNEPVDSSRNLVINIPPQQYEAEQVAKEEIVSPIVQDKATEIDLLRQSKEKLRKSRTIEINAKSEVEDMTRVDRNKRTVLHRAAIDQNVQLIEELCDRAAFSPFLSLETFVNLRDMFGNTALLNACVYNGDYGEERRSECINVLLENKADPNIANERTLWTPLAWCAHYGDYEGTKSLLAKGAWPFWPDRNGFYPLDHCGMKDKTHGGGEDRKHTAKIIVQSIIELVEEFDKDKKIPEMAERYIQADTYRFLKIPLLRASTLYWAIYFKLDVDKYVLPILRCSSIYPEMPVLGANMRNSYHACCAVGNLKALTILFDSEVVEERYKRILVNKTGEIALDIPASDKNKKETRIVFFEIKKEEKKNKVYEKEFFKYIKNMSKWVTNFQHQVVKHTIINLEELQPLPYYEVQDDFGNTPLHLASFSGHSNVASFLLTKSVNIDIENNDGWRCHEFQQHESIKKAYREYFEKRFTLGTNGSPRGSNKPNKISIQNLGTLALKKKATLKENIVIKSSQEDKPKAKPSNLFRRKIENAFNKALVMQQEERIIPDVVLLFETNKVKEDNKRNNPVSNRANFNISLIQTRIDCYMAMGVSKGLFYLMLKMDEKSLDQECYQNRIKVKLLNDYNYLRFDPTKKTDFEPFRSRQRQEITLVALGNIVDFNQLKELKVVSSIYPMHTVSGVEKIRKVWIKSKKWYLPEPFYSFTEYFKEGKNLDFSAITSLKVYFGEKFSFYFAWVSFYMCALLLLAIPGTVVFILEHLRPSYIAVLLPAWVLYNSLVSSLLVERWKRKNAEIATRWGTIDLLNKEIEESHIRKEYSGDEVISDATGTLTKFNKQNVKMRYYVISFLIFIACSAAVIYSYVGTEELKRENTEWILQFLIGTINGLVVAIINFFYEMAARSFVEKENHKHEESFEKSLVFKMFTFKAVNSYLGILYLTFVRQKELSEIFTSLVSLMLTTQGTSIGLSLLLPYVQYKIKESRYFKKVKKNAKKQTKAAKDRMLAEDSDTETTNAKEKSKKNTKGKKKEDYVFKRAILDCKSGTPVEAQWDLTQVELNSLKPEKKDIIDYYGSLIVQFGFITMFAPAFSLGPAIAMVVNVIDTKAKIWSFLNIYKRPIAEKSGGIGSWLTAWEIISILGVIVNALTLFFRLDTSLGGLENIFKQDGDDEQLEGVSSTKNINRLWVFVIAVHIILVLKYLIIGFVFDKPKWVVNQEEKQKFEEEQALDLKKNQENIFRLKSMGNQDADFAKELMAKNKKVKKVMSFASQQSVEEPAKKKLRYHTVSKINKGTTKSSIEDVSVVQTTGQGLKLPLSKPRLNLNQAIKSVFLNTFTQIERELTTRRMADINKLRSEKIIECFFCLKGKSVFYCQECNEYFCESCRTQTHDKINSSAHTVIPYDSIMQAPDTNKSQKMTRSKKVEPLKTLSQVNPDEPNKNYWRKFESFNFPVTKGGNFYYQLKVAFQTLERIYITENGITKQNELKDIERALKFRKHIEEVPDSKQNIDDSTDQEELTGKLDSLYEEALNDFLDNDAYNIEEKYFMNRIAYLNFKRRGAEATFDEFFKKITILQEGALESKLFLLFDLLDQDDNGYVSKNEIEHLFKGSFIQNLKLQDEFDSILENLFSNVQQINKKSLFQIALKEARIKNLFRTLTQS